MKVLAIIPARGGSKGIPNKNMKLFSEKPLIEWTINSALKSNLIDEVFVSTDNVEIANFAKNLGLNIPFLRDKSLALDSSYVIDTVLDIMEKFTDYGSMILLQPTSPLRNTEDIDAVIKLALDNNYNSVISITEPIYSSHLFCSIKKNNTIESLIENKGNFNRQDFQNEFVINGACYFATREFLFENKKFVNSDTCGYIMPQERSVDIDTLFDWRIAQLLHKS